jgi:hypothetical protein
MRVVLAVLCIPGLIAAQQGGASVAVGAVSVRYGGAKPVSSISLAPTLTYLAPTAFIGLNGSVAQFSGQRLASQGTLEVATFTPPTSGGAMGEVGFSVGASSHTDGVSTGQGVMSARFRLLRERASAWIGAGAGQLWDGTEWSGVRESELGLSLRGDFVSFTARVAPTVALDSLHYTDVVAAMTWSTDRIDWSASVGNRAGANLPFAASSDRTWGGVSASYWIAQRTALVLAGGTYPVDLTQGFPAGKYIALSLRLGGARRLAAAEAADARAARRMARRAGIEAFELRRGDDGSVELRVRAPDARTVEWLGDPTRWEAVPLVRAGDGWWRARFEAVGTVELVLRLDGGAWIVPPGAETVTDEFGGRVGRITLPSGTR